MSAQDYVREKAGEPRHNKMVVTSCSSLAQCSSSAESTALSMSGEPNWFLLIPYVPNSAQALYLELAFLVFGLFLIAIGLAFGLHANHDRSLYMRELGEARNSDSLLMDFRAKSAVYSRKKKS